MSDFNANIAGQMARENLHSISQGAGAASEAKSLVAQYNKKSEELKTRAPEIEDLATITSSVRTEENTRTLNRIGLIATQRLGVDVEKTLKDFADLYAQSRSHNLLYERFITKCKLSAVQTALGIMGVEPRELIDIQNEVKGEALARIDDSLRKDWAEAKALMTIVG